MQNYDFSHLASDLDDWMQQRFLTPILFVEGGWEYWVQIDFPAWLDASRDTQFNFRREQNLGGGRVDWLVNGDTSGLHGVGVAVELKAQTHKYRSSQFTSDVMDDVEKLRGWVEHGRIERGIALAIAIDPSAVSSLIDHGFVELFTWAASAKFLVRVVDPLQLEARC